jgi:hypothetical protein
LHLQRFPAYFEEGRFPQTTRIQGIGMKSKSTHLLLAGILATTVMCGSAQAARGISTNEWEATGESSTPPGSYLVPSSLPVDSEELPNTLSLAGVNSLSFAEGSGSSVNVNTLMDGPGVAYFTDGPNAQVVLLASSFGSASSFTIEFDYAPGFTPPTPTLELVGATEDYKISVSDSSGWLKDANSGIFNFVNGVLSPSSDNDHGFASDGLHATSDAGWSVVATPTGNIGAAPEIDPASAASALTLLAGFLAIMFGKVPRTLMEPKRS